MPHAFQSIAAKYDGFIIDLWGVVHDGTALYPGAKEALDFLHAEEKPVVFLSNAPRRAHKVTTRLTELGIPAEYYAACITSGEVAYHWLSQSNKFGKKYFYLGPSKDEDILSELADYQRVTLTLDADFILNTGYQYDFQPHAEIIPVLKKLVAEEKPLLCVNPDLEVVKQDGTQMLCAGTLAAEYEKLGGRVTFVGKPHARVYEACRAHLPKARLLAIGDNLLTDMKGANAARIDAMLITGGVLKVQHQKLLGPAEALGICRQEGVSAQYVLPAFSLGE